MRAKIRITCKGAAPDHEFKQVGGIVRITPYVEKPPPFDPFQLREKLEKFIVAMTMHGAGFDKQELSAAWHELLTAWTKETAKEFSGSPDQE